MSDIIENEEIDKDIINKETLSQQFNIPYRLLTETAVSLKKSYINKLHGNKSLQFAVSLSDYCIEVYRLSGTSLNKVCKLSGHEDITTEVVCSSQEEHIVYSAGNDGLIKKWDTRTSGSCVSEYQDEDEEVSRKFECMDVSHNGRVICAGTQLVEDDAYLVFWDDRVTKPLGGYWNSHTDDITQVKFHKEKSEILATGAIDGLLNVYNIMEQKEEDALTYSLNVENSVGTLSWLDSNRISCITQSSDLQVWDCSSGDLVKNLDRDKICRSIKRSRSDDCYLVDTYYSKDDVPVLLAGSNSGIGVCLRSVAITDKKLRPHTNFTENKQIVRCCWYDRDRDLLVTAGEAGIITVWTGGVATAKEHFTAKTAPIRSSRHKPY